MQLPYRDPVCLEFSYRFGPSDSELMPESDPSTRRGSSRCGHMVLAGHPERFLTEFRKDAGFLSQVKTQGSPEPGVVERALGKHLLRMK